MAVSSESQLKLVISAVDEMSSTINAVNSKLQQMNDTVEKSNKASAGAAMSFGKMTGALALGSIVATGISRLASSLQSMTQSGIAMSGQLEQSQATIYKLGANVGWTKEKIDGLVGAIRSENKDILTSIDITKTAIQAGLNEAQALDIVSKARDVASAANVSSNDAIRAMTTSLVKLDPEMLRAYGMSLNMSDVYSREAASLNKKSSELTFAEKKQAFYNAMMEAAAASQGSYTAAMDTWFKKANSVKDMMGDVQIVLGKLVSGAMKPIIDETYNAIKSFTQWALTSDGSLNPTLQSVADIIETVIMTVFNIGNAITTIIKDAFEPWIERMLQTGDTLEIVGIAIRIMGNWLVALIKTIGSVIVTISSFGSVLLDLSTLTRAVVKDGIDMWINYADVLKGVFDAIIAGLTGNFTGAKEILSGIVKKTFDDTIPAFNKFTATVKSASTNVAKSWSDSANSWATASDFQIESSGKAFNSFKLLSDLFGKQASENTKKSKDEMKKMEESYGKLIESVTKYADVSKNAYNEVGKSIDELQKKIGDLDNQHAEAGREIDMSFAEAYVKAVDDAKKVKDEINKVNNDINISLSTGDGGARSSEDIRGKQAELSNLQQDLKKRESEIAKYNTIAIAYSDEVAEVQRKNNQGDFTNTVETLNLKRAKLDDEYNNKRELMVKELAAELEKQAALKKIMENAQLELNLALKNQELSTIDSVNEQIKVWNKLAAAIALAQKGGTSQLISNLKTTQEISTISQKQKLQQPVNIYITGNTVFDEKKFSETILNSAMKQLNNNVKVK